VSRGTSTGFGRVPPGDVLTGDLRSVARIISARLDTQMAVPLARMLDDDGFDGVISTDHMIYPRELNSAYPSPSGIVPGQPETRRSLRHHGRVAGTADRREL
jgi:hypothetical protein